MELSQESQQQEQLDNQLISSGEYMDLQSEPTQQLYQQVKTIYSRFFKPINQNSKQTHNTQQKGDKSPFEQIDHGPVQLCPQMFSLQQNCLIVNFNAFDRYYPCLFNILKTSTINHSQEQKQQQQKQKQQQEEQKSSLKSNQMLDILRAADMILALNGENDRAWNIKKFYINKIYPTKYYDKKGINIGDESNVLKEMKDRKIMSLQWQLGFNGAVCLKNKKSSSYYQYRLLLIEKQLQQMVSELLDREQLGVIQQVTEQLQNSLCVILGRQNELINRVLGRYFRNYFCWMYRVKLLKLIIQFLSNNKYIAGILQSCSVSQEQQKYFDKREQSLRQRLIGKVLNIQLSNIHKFLEKYCNDYSGYSYLINFINRYYLGTTIISKSDNDNVGENNNNNKKEQQIIGGSSYALDRQLGWVKQLEEYCSVAYDSQQHYRHLIMYKNFLIRQKNQLQKELN